MAFLGTRGGRRTANAVSLALSLVFGFGQVGIGAFVAWRALGRAAWRSERSLVLGVVGLWFVCSGMAELFVSSMEVAQRLTNWPTAVAFALWRGRADGALLVATIALAAWLIGSLLVRRAGIRRR